MLDLRPKKLPRKPLKSKLVFQFRASWKKHNCSYSEESVRKSSWKKPFSNFEFSEINGLIRQTKTTIFSVQIESTDVNFFRTSVWSNKSNAKLWLKWVQKWVKKRSVAIFALLRQSEKSSQVRNHWRFKQTLLYTGLFFSWDEEKKKANLFLARESNLTFVMEYK